MGAPVFSLGLFLLFFLQFAVLNQASPAHYLAVHASDAVKKARVSIARFLLCGCERCPISAVANCEHKIKN